MQCNAVEFFFKKFSFNRRTCISNVFRLSSRFSISNFPWSSAPHSPITFFDCSIFSRKAFPFSKSFRSSSDVYSTRLRSSSSIFVKERQIGFDLAKKSKKSVIALQLIDFFESVSQFPYSKKKWNNWISWRGADSRKVLNWDGSCSMSEMAPWYWERCSNAFTVCHLFTIYF